MYLLCIAIYFTLKSMFFKGFDLFFVEFCLFFGAGWIFLVQKTTNCL